MWSRRATPSRSGSTAVLSRTCSPPPTTATYAGKQRSIAASIHPRIDRTKLGSDAFAVVAAEGRQVNGVDDAIAVEVKRGIGRRSECGPEHGQVGGIDDAVAV